MSQGLQTARRSRPFRSSGDARPRQERGASENRGDGSGSSQEEELIRLKRILVKKDQYIEEITRRRDHFIMKMFIFSNRWNQARLKIQKLKRLIGILSRKNQELRRRLRLQRQGSVGEGFTDYDSESENENQGEINAGYISPA